MTIKNTLITAAVAALIATSTAAGGLAPPIIEAPQTYAPSSTIRPVARPTDPKAFCFWCLFSPAAPHVPNNDRDDTPRRTAPPAATPPTADTPPAVVPPAVTPPTPSTPPVVTPPANDPPADEDDDHNDDDDQGDDGDDNGDDGDKHDREDKTDHGTEEAEKKKGGN